MAAFTELFGEKLKSKEGEVTTSSALGGKKGVLVYFSAHWCPPCRGFTPKLVEFHKKHAAGKGFETVFVSSDRDQGSFDEYYGEMPWLALPFDDRDKKNALSKQFKVQGIPMLVVLGPDGKVVTTEGRSKVMEDFEDCAHFPWHPPTFQDSLGDSFIKQDGSTVGKDALAGKTLGLYFSAHWCPPCRGFTPVLKEFYTEYSKKDSNFEIVFVSSDKTEDEMLSYFKDDHGSYLALPFAQRQQKNDLSTMFGVQGIPSFVIVGPDGEVINSNGRGKVQAGVDAVLAAGWEGPAVGNLEEGPEVAGTDINECPALVVMCGGCDTATVVSIEKALEPLAKKYIAEGKKTKEDPKYIFLYAKGGSILQQLQALTKECEEEIKEADGKPVMILFDIPDNGGFYFGGAPDITTENIEAFLMSKETGKAKRLQLSRG